VVQAGLVFDVVLYTNIYKQNLKVMSALKDFNNRNKIVKEGSWMPNIINEHFRIVGNRLILFSTCFTRGITVRNITCTE